MFRHKIFSIVKCLQMQMISGKIIVFPVFDCILENSLKNILQCLEQRKMKIKENLETYCKVQTHHRNPPIINSKPPSQQTRKHANPQTQQTRKPTNPANLQTHHHSTSELKFHHVALNHELIINCLARSRSRAASIGERSDPSSSPTAPPSTMSPTAPPSTTSSPTHH